LTYIRLFGLCKSYLTLLAIFAHYRPLPFFSFMSEYPTHVSFQSWGDGQFHTKESTLSTDIEMQLSFLLVCLFVTLRKNEGEALRTLEDSLILLESTLGHKEKCNYDKWATKYTDFHEISFCVLILFALSFILFILVIKVLSTFRFNPLK
jgi:hypothetical protein